MKRITFLFLTAVTILFFHANSGCQSRNDAFLTRTDSAASRTPSAEYVYSGIIVKFKPDAFNEQGELNAESILALNAEYGLVSMERILRDYIYELTFPEGADINKLVQEYASDPYVVYAEPNYTMRALEKDQNAD